MSFTVKFSQRSNGDWRAEAIDAEGEVYAVVDASQFTQAWASSWPYAFDLSLDEP